MRFAHQQPLSQASTHLSVVRVEPPPTKLKANPTLETVHAVERILREAYANREPPLSYAEIGRRLPAKRTRFEVIQTSVLELVRHKFVTVGSDGVMWIVQDPRARAARHEPLA